jgi:AcrR family transcriptional regulator
MPATTTRRDQQRRRREENRALIVAAAENALRRKPFRDLSIDEVMQSAGLTRTIFYRHFDDLSELLIRVAGRAFEEVYDSAAGAASVAAPDGAALRAVLGPAVEAFAARGPLVRAIAEAASHDAEVDLAYSATFERFVALTAEALDRLTGASPTDAAQTARALTHMNVGYLIDVFGREPKVTPEVALATLSEIWAGTLSREPASRRA